MKRADGSERGAMFVEAALAIVPLFLILVSVADVGIYYFKRGLLEYYSNANSLTIAATTGSTATHRSCNQIASSARSLADSLAASQRGLVPIRYTVTAEPQSPFPRLSITAETDFKCLSCLFLKDAKLTRVVNGIIENDSTYCGAPSSAPPCGTLGGGNQLPDMCRVARHEYQSYVEGLLSTAQYRDHMLRYDMEDRDARN